MSWEAANRTIQPYLVQAVADDAPEGSFMVRRAETVEFPTFWTFHKAVVPPTGQVGVNLVGASWLLPRTVIQEDHGRVADVLLPNPGLTFYMLVAGGQVSKVDPSRAGLNPAWRKAGAHVVIASLWPDSATNAEIQEERNMIRERSKDLRTLAPESGAYFNESHISSALSLVTTTSSFWV
ncbi:hypothetical protein GSI_02516 [Ganoderma sinense ZZ0214-1]|uniref:Uncharacterized protein n=1 Tax=Ganoderma sinense ZZ0214-1 TaxID=1077348 RepID=A0A2G8SPU2_9APHY|nr:hypothetical protein GSI_02516 [Ganoderma sinense ZZ0214-1]